MNLVALKRVRYPRGHGAVEYAPGQEFEAPDEHAKVLIAIGSAGKSEILSAAPTILDMPKPKRIAEDDGERDAVSELRAEYKALVGKRPFPGWDAEEIRERMLSYRNKALSGDDLDNK